MWYWEGHCFVYEVHTNISENFVPKNEITVKMTTVEAGTDRYSTILHSLLPSRSNYILHITWHFNTYIKK
jgi:hypothetical protein